LQISLADKQEKFFLHLVVFFMAFSLTSIPIRFTSVFHGYGFTVHVTYSFRLLRYLRDISQNHWGIKKGAGFKPILLPEQKEYIDIYFMHC
jgi:hypothetical protein